MKNIILQAELNSCLAVKNNDVIRFNKVIYCSQGISYDKDIGKITVQDRGIFTLNWWLELKSGYSYSNEILSIHSSQGEISPLNSFSHDEKIFGSATIEINNVPFDLCIKNNGSQDIVLTSYSVIQGAVVVLDESEGY